MLKIVFTVFFFIILAELLTVSLHGQLVFCTYALFGTLEIHYECGRAVMALDSRSDVRGFKPPHHRRSFFSVPEFFLVTIFMIFSLSYIS